MKRVILVICQQTQTDDDRRKVLSGQNSVLLNQTGLVEAMRLARRVAKLPEIRAIFSSDLARAAYLAHEIGKSVRRTPILTADLREVNVGKLAGLSEIDAEEAFPDPLHRTGHPAFDFSEVGGETRSRVLSRHRGVLDLIANRYGSFDPENLKRVVVVGHRSALWCLLEEHRLARSLHAQGEYQEVVWPPQG